MSRHYNAALVNARILGLKKSTIVVFFLGLMTSVVYLGYALAFYYGAILLESGEI